MILIDNKIYFVCCSVADPTIPIYPGLEPAPHANPIFYIFFSTLIYVAPLVHIEH